MATIYRKSELFPRDVQRQYKSLGNIGPGGTEVWAPVFALDAGSIGGGGGGGGGIVQQGAKDASAVSWDVNVTNASIAITGGPLAVTGTFWQATQPVSGPLTDAQLRAAVVPTLDTAVRDRLPATLGQKTMVNSLAVVLASDQTAIPVSGTFFQATQPVSIAAAVAVTDNGGSLTVDAPVGTPLFARLSDGAAALIGQKAMASSLPVTLASDQSTLPVSIASAITANPATGQGKTLLFAVITQGGAGTTSIVAADATKKVKVVSYTIVMDGAGTAKFNDGTVDLTGAMSIAANGGVAIAGAPSAHILETAAINRALSIVTTGAAAKGHISYFLEA